MVLDFYNYTPISIYSFLLLIFRYIIVFMLEDFPNNSNEEEKSRIGRMEEKLYSRTEEIKQKDRTKLRPKKFFGTEDWEGNEDSLRFEKKERPHHMSLYGVIFTVSLTFFIVAGALAGFMILNKKQPTSPDNVSISVFGPVSVGSGDILSLQVLIENKNNVSLQNADLLLEFPEGARYPNQSDKTFERFHKTLGTIAPGEVRTETIKAILLGEEKSIKDIAITTKYQIEGSDAKFTKNKGYVVTLTTPALAVRTELLKEATAGQEVTLSTDVESNSQSLLKGALLQVDYPQGFVFESATPAPSFGDNVWKLGDMAQGDHRHVEIKGIIHGENTQEKVFRIYTGVAKSDTPAAFDTVFSSLLRGLVIKKPFLGVEIVVNGSTDPNFVFDRPSGDVSILWRNNLPDKIIDGQIEVSIKGETINKSTIVSQDDGFYRSTEDVIFWDQRASKSLSVIPAGGKSSVGFSFTLLPLVSGNNIVFRNPEIEIGVSVKGKRISENNVPEEINSFVTKKFKVATNVQFAARSVYYVGPFSNRGPLPPKVQTETTYTIMWTIQNTANSVSDGTVKAVLPPYVEWKNLVSPNGSNLVYNPISHEILWDIGAIKSGTGYETEPQEVSFQIGLVPGLAQVGKTPALISGMVFTGKDDFTGGAIEINALPISIMLSTDPQFDVQGSMVSP